MTNAPWLNEREPSPAEVRSRTSPVVAPKVAAAPIAVAPTNPSSRIPGFYKKSCAERVELLRSFVPAGSEADGYLRSGGGLSVGVADAMSENVIATFGLPFSVALNFRINRRDVLIPMTVEEPSVVAAASNAARMVRATGGFFGDADEPVMTAQVQLDGVPSPARAKERLQAEAEAILQEANALIPSMVKRGGGTRGLDVRIVDETSGLLVVHIHVDVRDAMGANVVDTVAEGVADRIAEIAGGKRGLCILTNLPLGRKVRVRAQARAEDVGGPGVADAIARASRFAELDEFRAVTHNKGFLNGLDAAAIALGQDFRSIEAGAHAFAGGAGSNSADRRYRPLATWRRTPEGLEGTAELPLAVGTVGGSARAHAGVRTGMALAGVSGAQELAVVLASVGLASNLAALRALSAEGIQAGHMRLHARKEAVCNAAKEESSARRETR